MEDVAQADGNPVKVISQSDNNKKVVRNVSHLACMGMSIGDPDHTAKIGPRFSITRKK